MRLLLPARVRTAAAVALHGERLCEGGCGRSVHPAEAHTHHHEPGCGQPRTALPCRCSYYLCRHCCPCDIEALVGAVS